MNDKRKNELFLFLNRKNQIFPVQEYRFALEMHTNLFHKFGARTNTQRVSNLKGLKKLITLLLLLYMEEYTNDNFKVYNDIFSISN